MLDVKPEMHQIRFLLGLRPLGRLHCSPDPLAVFKGPTSKCREELEVREKEGEGKGYWKKGRGRGRKDGEG